MGAIDLTIFAAGLLIGILTGYVSGMMGKRPSWPTGDPAIDRAFIEFVTAPREEDIEAW